MAVCSSVAWEPVARRVVTRNAMQCRRKWLFSWLGSGRAKWKRTWGCKEDLRLIDQLAEKSDEDEDEVDWVSMFSCWENARSPQYLRQKWSCLRRQVPGYALKSYSGGLVAGLGARGGLVLQG